MLNVSLRNNISQPAFGNKLSNRNISVSFSSIDSADELDLDFTTSVSTDGGDKTTKEKFKNLREKLGKVINRNNTVKADHNKALKQFYSRLVYKDIIVDKKGDEKAVKPAKMSDELNLKSVEADVTVRGEDGTEEKFKVNVVRNEGDRRGTLRKLTIKGRYHEKFEYYNKDSFGYMIYTEQDGIDHKYKISNGYIYAITGRNKKGDIEEEMDYQEQRNLKKAIINKFADTIYPDPDNKKTGRSTPTPAKKNISDPTPKNTSSLLIDLKPEDTDFQI